MTSSRPSINADVSHHLKEPPEISLAHLYDLNRSWPARLAAKTAQSFLRNLFRICFRLQADGIDTLPQTGTFLLCPNHQSYVDPFLIYSMLPSELLERTLFVADRVHFEKPALSWMNRFGRVLLTGRNGKLAECVRLAYEGLRQGMIVCIFPEGRRTRTGQVMEPYRGVSLLSKESGTPIVPIYIDGALNVLSNFHAGFQFCKITLTVDLPIQPAPGVDMLELWRGAITRMETARQFERLTRDKAVMETAPHA